MTLKDLKNIAIEDTKQRHPALPDYALYVKPYSEKTANDLTRSIIDFLKFHNNQAERISCTGRYNRKTGKYIRASMQKGTADISSIIRGRDAVFSVKIEIKHGKFEKQSEPQKKYQAEIERCGGYYWIVKTWNGFIEQYNLLTL